MDFSKLYLIAKQSVAHTDGKTMSFSTIQTNHQWDVHRKLEEHQSHSPWREEVYSSVAISSWGVAGSDYLPKPRSSPATFWRQGGGTSQTPRTLAFVLFTRKFGLLLQSGSIQQHIDCSGEQLFLQNDSQHMGPAQDPNQ